MKKTIFIMSSLLMVIPNLFSQDKNLDIPIDKETGKITYTEIVLVDSTITKDILYSKAREWFAKTYNSANTVIQMDSKESGIIIGKALHRVYFKSKYDGGSINYTISIFFKNGRYKYEITDFYHKGGYINGRKTPDGGSCENLLLREKGFWGNSYKKTYYNYLQQMDKNINLLLISLNESLQELSQEKKDKNDW